MGDDKGQLVSVWYGSSKPRWLPHYRSSLRPLYAKPDLPQWARFFLVVGGLGAFTTFSTFAFEMLQLMMAESYVQALWYGAVQVVGGLILCWVGMLIVRLLCTM